jgi:uncharacterized protein (TIGR01777 family)
MRVLLTGGTGFLGRAITLALVARGDQAVVVSRREAAAHATFAEHGDQVTVVGGDVTSEGPWQDAIAGCDAVINLAGEPLAGQRWDARVRQILRDSRIDATRFVVEAIARLDPAARPRVLVSASGIDYYPFSLDLGRSTRFDDDDPIDEKAPPGSSFLARLCRDWEAEALAATGHGVRVVLMRTGLVLGNGGALDRMTTPFKLFAGGRIGSGKQWTSWVHQDDVVAAYLFAIDHDALSGPANLVAPHNVRNAELARAIGKRLGRPSWLPVPAAALKLAVGELAEYILNGRRAVPAALQAAGFEFSRPTLAGALAATAL